MSTGNPPGTSAGLAFPVLDERLSARLQDRLAEVEKALSGHVRSRAGFVTEAASHLMEAGGKRFRPLLVLLAAETGEHPDVEDVITAACVVELTHLASLYHDDVMDEAELRRGSASANARWDNHVAILTGDFLFSKSSELTAELGPDAVRIQAQTFTALVEGQILETHRARSRRGRARALPGRRGREDRLADRHVGEVRRDLRRRDHRGPAGPDQVRRGRRRRVPALRRHPRRRLRVRRLRQDPRHRPARGRADAAGAHRPRHRAPRGRPADRAARRRRSPTTRCHAETLALLRRHPAVDEARAYVIARAAEAKAQLAAVPEGPVRTALEEFADIVATRAS